MTMNIYKALKQIDPKNKMYFQWKFPDTRYFSDREVWTEEQFLRNVQRKTISSFVNWEQTDEYKNLVQLYLNSKLANDFLEIYTNVTQAAKDGDEKSIKLFLGMQKDVQHNAKLASQLLDSKEEIEEDDDLIL